MTRSGDALRAPARQPPGPANARLPDPGEARQPPAARPAAKGARRTLRSWPEGRRTGRRRDHEYPGGTDPARRPRPARARTVTRSSRAHRPTARRRNDARVVLDSTSTQLTNGSHTARGRPSAPPPLPKSTADVTPASSWSPERAIARCASMGPGPTKPRACASSSTSSRRASITTNVCRRVQSAARVMTTRRCGSSPSDRVTTPATS